MRHPALIRTGSCVKEYIEAVSIIQMAALVGEILSMCQMIEILSSQESSVNGISALIRRFPRFHLAQSGSSTEIVCVGLITIILAMTWST